MICPKEVEINIMEIDSTFWVAVSFVIFFGGLIYLKIPQKINEILNKLILDIKNEIDESERLRTEAKTLLDNAQNKLDKADSVKNEIIDQAKKDGDRLIIALNDKFHKSSDLKKNLEKLNITLIITNTDLGSSIKNVINKYQIDNIYTQREWTRDEIIQEKNIPNDINLIRDFDQFMYSPNDVSEIYEKIPRGFSNFRKKCEKLLTIRDILPCPKQLNIHNQIDEVFDVPSLPDLGFENFEVHEKSAFKFSGGENSGINRVEEYFFQSKNISKYKLTRNGLLGENYSSKISSWLSNGCISAKYVYSQIKLYEKTVEKNDSTYWLFFELIWRDFFKYVSMQHKINFSASMVFMVTTRNGQLIIIL